MKCGNYVSVLVKSPVTDRIVPVLRQIKAEGRSLQGYMSTSNAELAQIRG